MSRSKCFICANDIEDEFHFTLICPLYNNIIKGVVGCGDGGVADVASCRCYTSFQYSVLKYFNIRRK